MHIFPLKQTENQMIDIELENGVSPGHTPLGSQSPSLTLHPSFPQGGRRESFLYRSDSDYDMSPKNSVSRNSIASEGHAGEDFIVTPFAQVLASLRSVRSNFTLLANVSMPTVKSVLTCQSKHLTAGLRPKSNAI
uniref:3',5'-cyclic-AMP phosphodiesterase n=1 Tax=Hucho hucho TaxID=62062 RepID=A0A4W5LB55_9TELE